VVAVAPILLFSLCQLVEKRRQGARIRPATLLPAVLVVLVSLILVATRWQLLVKIVPRFLWSYERGTRPIYAWLWLVRHEALLLILGALGLALGRLDRRFRWSVLITVGLYTLGSLLFRVFFVRWLLPLISIAALFTGATIAKVMVWKRRPVRYLVVAGLCVAYLFVAWDSASLMHNLANDVRERTWIWIRENIPPGARLAVQGDWLSTGTPSETYRVEQFERLTGGVDAYSEQGFNYLIPLEGNLDYYNWRRAESSDGPGELHEASDESAQVLHQETGTILHIPVPVRVEIVQITSNPVYPEGHIVLGAGWHAPELEQSSGVEYRWMTDRGQVIFNSPQTRSQARVLSFDAYVFRDKGEISVYVNGQRQEHLALSSPGTLHHVEVPVHLTAGLNTIELVSERGCGQPIVFDPESRDQRCISIKVGNLALQTAQD
jgi:hypothetical protein